MQQEDQNWPRRKKSDLMVGRLPDYQLLHRRLEKVPRKVEDGGEIIIPIQRKPAPYEKVTKQAEDMWPRRKKSDLLIYQQTRNI